MSLRSLLMPVISQRLLSRRRLLRERARTEGARAASGVRHVIHYFHQVDDPYSALCAAVLPKLAARYDADLVPHLVGPPRQEVAPERDKLVAYSRKDAQLLARRWGLDYADALAQPAPEAVADASARLLTAIAAGSFVETAGGICAALWRGAPAEGVPPPAALAAQLEQGETLRKQWGHYLGATFYYGGEWYWGLDRLHHLEARLQDLGVQRAGVSGALFPPVADLGEPVNIAEPAPIDFFFSLRSPYSAIVAKRVFSLGRLTGAPVNLRFVLPMVMRGLPVPADKRRYISRDTAREAHVRGIPFGRLNDPVGRPTERGLAVMPLAERAGSGQDYVLSFMRGVWAEGIDAGSDRGLRKIVERAGLSWSEARQALEDEAWRKTAEHNREQMFALGLWGVPSFRVRDTAVWGQDRLWAIQEALLEGSGRPSTPAPANDPAARS